MYTWVSLVADLDWKGEITNGMWKRLIVSCIYKYISLVYTYIYIYIYRYIIDIDRLKNDLVREI